MTGTNPGDGGRRWPQLPLLALVLGLIVAVGSPALWWVNRPSGRAGSTFADGPQETTPNSTPDSTPDSTPTVGRPAAVGTRPAAPPSPRAGDPAPVRVRIASLGVDAAVDPVGVEPDGSMVIPREARRVGWYRYGPAPGAQQGNAVLAGHVDSAVQGRGALYALRGIEVGDRIQVGLADGSSLRYRVRGKETVVKRRLPTERIFGREGAARLVLITCGGPFIKELSSYRDNLVVVAVPEE